MTTSHAFMHTSWEKLTKYLLEQKHFVYVAEDNKTYGIQYTFFHKH